MRASSADPFRQKRRPVVSPLNDGDLHEADRIHRLALGSFLGDPGPPDDRDCIYSRRHSHHVAAFGAKLDGKLVGSNFVTNWGSVGFVGPLTVHPDLHGCGIGRALLDKGMAQFDVWGTQHVGLFTFAQSAKHIALYQKYGFFARFLTAIMSAPAVPRRNAVRWSRFSKLHEVQQKEALRSCRNLTDALYSGLDLTEEIRATYAQRLGDTVLVNDAGRGVVAFAICHYGPHSEAGSSRCLIKFGAVLGGPSAKRDYLRLLDAGEALAVSVGTPSLLAGANMARHEAYSQLVARGFRTEIQGVAMHRQNHPGYSHPGAYVIDDWR
jgi:GNAT superfamily N-acetyltransferase